VGSEESKARRGLGGYDDGSIASYSVHPVNATLLDEKVSHSCLEEISRERRGFYINHMQVRRIDSSSRPGSLTRFPLISTCSITMRLVTILLALSMSLSPLASAAKSKGTVKSFDESTGLGIITPVDGSKDIFVQFPAIPVCLHEHRA